MLKVGITGGIGSGKTTVCQVFHTLGIPVFYADDAAKYLMEHDAALISKIKTLFGDEVYLDNKLDRVRVSAIVFREPHKLEALNALVHPATVAYAKEWFTQQQAPYAIKEAAIFFESGTNKDIDLMIGVSAPKELRLQRAMQRSSANREEILNRMAQQMDEDEKMKLCDYVIINKEQRAIIPQVMEIHKILLAKSNAS